MATRDRKGSSFFSSITQALYGYTDIVGEYTYARKEV
jgi:hypothetical protein